MQRAVDGRVSVLIGFFLTVLVQTQYYQIIDDATMRKSYMSGTTKLRVALTDLFDWSAWNVRDKVDNAAWVEIRSHFSELKGILDEQHAVKSQRNLTPNDVLDALDIE